MIIDAISASGDRIVEIYIVNLCLTTGDFPISCKSSIVIPLIKKPGLDREKK